MTAKLNLSKKRLSLIRRRSSARPRKEVKTEPCSEDKSSSRNGVLCSLIRKQKWEQVSNILMDVNEASGNLLEDESDCCDNAPVSEERMIHYACQFGAPLQIIQLLASKYKTSVDASDSNGRYPIHLAGYWGSSPEVIQCLIELNPTSAKKQDVYGKTPMHYVAEHYHQHCIQNLGMASTFNKMKATHDMFQVVQKLLEISPSSATIEDDEEMNAIEHAIESEADLSIIRLMQRKGGEQGEKDMAIRRRASMDCGSMVAMAARVSAEVELEDSGKSCFLFSNRRARYSLQ